MCACKENTKIKKRGQKKNKLQIGAGLIDKLIDILPFEAHIPSYQYCGPGTKLQKRLARGDPGINRLDAACKKHDIAYDMNSNSDERSVADKALQKEAMERVFSKDASIGERATALGVAAAMKAKRTLFGKGISKKKNGKKCAACKAKAKKTTSGKQIAKKKSKTSKKTVSGKGMTKKTTKSGKGVVKKNGEKQFISLAALVKKANTAIKKTRPENIDSAIEVAVRSINQSKKGKKIRKPRTIKLPTIEGGVLPLVPIFAGLSALGSIVGSAAGIANAINQVKRGQNDLQESVRHNKTMEAIAIGDKAGLGFYLHPNQTGDGFFLTPYSKNH